MKDVCCQIFQGNHLKKKQWQEWKLSPSQIALKHSKSCYFLLKICKKILTQFEILKIKTSVIVLIYKLLLISTEEKF